jgi:SAM-dependent methyltransferase
VRSWIPADRSIRILDLGCGYGALLHFLKEAGYIDLTGVDRSPEQVALAHELGLNFIHEGDIADTLSLAPDDTYDVVVAFDLLEHLTCQEALNLGDQLFRVIRPGGRLILHLPNAEGIFSSRILYGDMTHERAYTRSSVTQLMSACGFLRVTSAEDTPVAHSLTSALRLLIWKLLRLFFRLVYIAETGDARQPILSQNFITTAERP